MRLLLLSNSRNHASGYLDHAEGDVLDLYRGIERVLFVPFALHDRPGYAAKVRERFEAMRIGVDRLDPGPGSVAAVERASAFFIGGGNTFRLLRTLQESDLLDPIRRRVHDGAPYMGSSAGTVVACPTLKTTNDMPIVAPMTFEALGLVPFQINCHYIDADPKSRHMGETRELRLREFLEENDGPVLGLREGTMLDVRGDDAAARIVIKGPPGACLFRRSRPPEEIADGTDVSYLGRG